ncbi:MAG: hypothetical protein L0338_20260 [Acidobacteria bacterium]|nr:hypothetical protein [Acidobacteriota bacterium]
MDVELPPNHALKQTAAAFFVSGSSWLTRAAAAAEFDRSAAFAPHVKEHGMVWQT